MTAVLRALDRAIRYLGVAALAVSAACLLAIMVIGSVDAITTNVFEWAVPAALEGSEVLLAVCIFLTFAYTQSRREHIAVDMFVANGPQWLRKLSVLLTLTIGAAIFAIFTWRAGALAMRSWNFDEHANAIIAFPVYPAKFLVCFGAAIATAEFLRQLVWFFIGDDHEHDADHARQDVA